MTSWLTVQPIQCYNQEQGHMLKYSLMRENIYLNLMYINFFKIKCQVQDIQKICKGLRSNKQINEYLRYIEHAIG